MKRRNNTGRQKRNLDKSGEDSASSGVNAGETARVSGNDTSDNYPKHAREHAVTGMNRFERWMVGLGILGIVVAAGAGLIYWWQLTEMQSSSTLTREVLERPYLFFESIRMINDVKQNRKLIFILKFRNSGHTPAIRARLNVNSRTIPVPTPVAVPDSTLVKNVDPLDTPFDIASDGSIEITRFMDVSAAELSDFENNVKTLMIYGFIEYSDEFGASYPREKRNSPDYCMAYLAYDKRLEGVPEFTPCTASTIHIHAVQLSDGPKVEPNGQTKQ